MTSVLTEMTKRGAEGTGAAGPTWAASGVVQEKGGSFGAECAPGVGGFVTELDTGGFVAERASGASDLVEEAGFVATQSAAGADGIGSGDEGSAAETFGFAAGAETSSTSADFAGAAEDPAAEAGGMNTGAGVVNAGAGGMSAGVGVVCSEGGTSAEADVVNTEADVVNAEAGGMNAALHGLPAIDLDELAGQAALLKRVDRKYLIAPELALELVEYLGGHGARALSIDGARQFCYLSDYFDTPDFGLHKLAATKRRRRFKVRSRIYLDSGLHFAEVKTRGGRGHNIKDRLRLENIPLRVCQDIGAGLCGQDLCGPTPTAPGLDVTGFAAQGLAAPTQGGAGQAAQVQTVPGLGASTPTVPDLGAPDQTALGQATLTQVASAQATRAQAIPAPAQAIPAPAQAAQGRAMLGQEIVTWPQVAEWVAAQLVERGIAETRRAGTRIVAGLRTSLRSVYTRSTLHIPGECRLTIDQDLTLEDPRGSASYRVPAVVVETKSGGGSSRADRWLWRRGARPTRFSKYAAGVAKVNPALPANRWHRTLNNLGEMK